MTLKKVSVLAQKKFLIKVRVVIARVYAFAAYVPIDKDDILSAKIKNLLKWRVPNVC